MDGVEPRRPQRAPQTMIRTLAFTPALNGSHQRVLNKDKTQLGLPFKKKILAAVWRTEERTGMVARPIR